MNKNNYIFYAIIIYIIIISILIITKPDCIYDHNNSKFRQFGYTEGKTMFPIGILSIFVAVIIIILFSFIGNFDNNNNNNNNNNIMLPQPQTILGVPNYQYNMMGGGQPIYQYQQPPIYQYHQPIYQQPHTQQQVPFVKTTLSSEQTMPNFAYQMPVQQFGGCQGHQILPQFNQITTQSVPQTIPITTQSVPQTMPITTQSIPQTTQQVPVFTPTVPLITPIASQTN
jgi:hypothetical protein